MHFLENARVERQLHGLGALPCQHADPQPWWAATEETLKVTWKLALTSAFQKFYKRLAPVEPEWPRDGVVGEV